MTLNEINKEKTWKTKEKLYCNPHTGLGEDEEEEEEEIKQEEHFYFQSSQLQTLYARNDDSPAVNMLAADDSINHAKMPPIRTMFVCFNFPWTHKITEGARQPTPDINLWTLKDDLSIYLCGVTATTFHTDQQEGETRNVNIALRAECGPAAQDRASGDHGCGGLGYPMCWLGLPLGVLLVSRVTQAHGETWGHCS